MTTIGALFRDYCQALLHAVLAPHQEEGGGRRRRRRRRRRSRSCVEAILCGGANTA